MHLSRDATTGSLTQRECIEDADEGGLFDEDEADAAHCAKGPALYGTATQVAVRVTCPSMRGRACRGTVRLARAIGHKVGPGKRQPIRAAFRGASRPGRDRDGHLDPAIRRSLRAAGSLRVDAVVSDAAPRTLPHATPVTLRRSG